MLFFLPPIAGNALMWKLPRDDRYGILAGLYIVSTFSFLAFNLLLS